MVTASGSQLQELLLLRNSLLSGTLDGNGRAHFAALAGQLAHAPSVPLVRALVEDPLDIVRYNAICSLVLRLGQRSPDVIDLCWRRFEEDEDADVRRMALACLASLHFGSFNLPFFERIEQLIRSPQTDEDVLPTAYQTLFQIAGLPPTEWPDRMASREPIRREEIDWLKVARLRAQVEAEQKRRAEPDRLPRS